MPLRKNNAAKPAPTPMVRAISQNWNWLGPRVTSTVQPLRSASAAAVAFWRKMDCSPSVIAHRFPWGDLSPTQHMPYCAPESA